MNRSRSGNSAASIPRTRIGKMKFGPRHTENPKRAIPRAKAEHNKNVFMDYQVDSKRVCEEKNKVQKENQVNDEPLADY